MNENYTNLKNTMNNMEKEYIKFSTKKVKLSGVNMRKDLLTVKKLCDTLRKQITQEINQIPRREKKVKVKSDEKKDEIKIKKPRKANQNYKKDDLKPDKKTNDLKNNLVLEIIEP